MRPAFPSLNVFLSCIQSADESGIFLSSQDSDQAEDGFTDILKLLADEDVDFLPYISWTSSHEHQDEELFEAEDKVWPSMDAAPSVRWLLEKVSPLTQTLAEQVN